MADEVRAKEQKESEMASLEAQGLAGWLLKPPSIEQLAQLLAQALEFDE
jgi:hypothetical protein